MKTLTILTVMLMLSLGSQAQSIIDKLYDKYSGMEGYTTVYISKYMFDMFKNKDADPKTQDDFQQVIGKLDCIKILATDDDPNTPSPINLYQEIMKQFPSSVYKEVMTVKDNGQDVRFFAREVNNKVAELLLIVSGKDGNALISIQGDIDMKNISKLGSAMHIEGMENLNKVNQK